MAIQDITKPMALDETLQATNTALGLLGKDTTLQSIVTALAGIGINTVGNLASLVTADKTSLVGAVNEVAGNVDDIDTAKADKVDSATSGNLASLDGNGNLADSGWKSDKTTTAVSGNPISISGLKSNQLAINPIIMLEPIQAGSGDPSPVNERPISGYDKIEVLSCGKNLVNIPDSSIGTNGYILYEVNCKLKAGTYSFSFNFTGTPSQTQLQFVKADGTYLAQPIFDLTAEGRCSCNAISISEDCAYINYYVNAACTLTNFQIEAGNQATTYEPYHKTTDLSLQIGQTIYGATLDLEKGVLTVDRGYINASDMDWVNQSGNLYYSYGVGSLADFNQAMTDKWMCSNLKIGDPASGNIGFSFDGTFGVVYVNVGGTLTSEILADMYFVYPLAAPYTIQLTPHEISLLKDYAYVSTNGTSIALDYHNGEMASLADVAQLGQTVNELGDVVNYRTPVHMLKIDENYVTGEDFYLPIWFDIRSPRSVVDVLFVNNSQYNFKYDFRVTWNGDGTVTKTYETLNDSPSNNLTFTVLW